MIRKLLAPVPGQFDLQRYQRRGAWQRKRERSEGARLADQAAAHYDRCADAFRELMGSLATAIASVFSVELELAP